MFDCKREGMILNIQKFMEMIDERDLLVSFSTTGLHNSHIASNVQVELDDEKLYISYVEGNDNIDLSCIHRIEVADDNIIHMIMTYGEYWISSLS